MVFSYLIEHNRYMSLVGIVAVLGIAYLCSTKRKKIQIRLVASALVMQSMLAFLILRTQVGSGLFEMLGHGFNKLYGFADAGGRFLFGNLADPSGPWGLIFAIKLVPIIIFFGALMSLLFHLGIVQLFVKAISFLVRPILGTSGAETLCAAANSMLGQTEAPLLIKHYLKRMTHSEILVVMVSGMSTLSGSILAVYGAMGVPMLHLLSASVIAIPGSILIAKMLLPETEQPETMGSQQVVIKAETNNVLDAVSQGTTDGLHLAVNVAAMLISFISLIALINAGLQVATGYTLDAIFGKVFYFVALLLGIDTGDATAAGTLLGQKLVINEFIAYASFVKMSLLPRTKIILTYALAGFANFSCIGIQIGGIGALAPEKRELLTKLGLRALLGGTLTNFLSAAIAGLFV